MSNRKHNTNSSEAYKSLDPDNLRKMYKDILWALGNLPDGGTWEQIAIILKEKESRIWRRLNEIEAMELIHRDGRRTLSSGRYGSIWRLGKAGEVAKTEKSLPGRTVSEYSKAILQTSLF